MFSWNVLNVKSYIQLLLCVYGIYFAANYIFQRFIKSQRGFSIAGAGYTFYPHSTGYPRVRKGVLFAKRTPFREKDLIFTKRTQETGIGLVFTNYFIVLRVK